MSKKPDLKSPEHLAKLNENLAKARATLAVLKSFKDSIPNENKQGDTESIVYQIYRSLDESCRLGANYILPPGFSEWDYYDQTLTIRTIGGSTIQVKLGDLIRAVAGEFVHQTERRLQEGSPVQRG